MAIDIPVSEEIIINTTNLRVKGVMFDFDLTSAVAIINFGVMVDGVFQIKRTEHWLLSGAFYISSIMVSPQGTTMAEALIGSVASVVMKIQTDPVLKQNLLDSGELAI